MQLLYTTRLLAYIASYLKQHIHMQLLYTTRLLASRASYLKPHIICSYYILRGF